MKLIPLSSAPVGVLEIRVLADREVIGLVGIDEDSWAQYTTPTTLRIDTVNAAAGYVDVKVHCTFENNPVIFVNITGLCLLTSSRRHCCSTEASHRK